jgi:beta-glucosidase
MRNTFLALFLIGGLTSFGQVYLDPNASIDDRVENLLSQMTLEEKIGQMTQAERGSIGGQGDSIKQYYLGSILSAGGSSPGTTVASWIEMYNTFQAQAMDTRLGIPLIYGIDAVHGNNNLFGAVIFPHNIGLGCTRNAELVEECARITALEVAATGMDWTFSPCLAVPRNERWGRTYEGFGESPDLVATMAEASVLGYQSDSLGNENSILACAKHFVADGGTQNGSDQGNAVISETELRNIHLFPYYDAIEQNVGSVMASFSSWNGDKCHGNGYLLTDVLKNEMGFEGFVISDWMGINQLGDFKSAIAQSINAGIDMAMQPNDYIDFITHLTALVNEETVSMSRIDDAVRRILRIKFQLGLFEDPYVDNSLADTVGCVSHRNVARQAVRESLVLLKNNGVLPLSKEGTRVVVAGSKADDIGVQCGGWSISWQGSSGDITPGTTIKEAVEEVVGSENVSYTASTSIPSGDVAVVVVGEFPYAEGAGDIPYGDDRFYISNSDQQIIDAVQSAGIPMVVVLLSGRPIMLEYLIDDADAMVAAWLPGTEGNGITDVLFGDYDFTGKLSHTWPRDEDMVPVNEGDGSNDPLFAYGFGLDYSATAVSEIAQYEPGNAFRVYPNPVAENLYIDNESGNVIDVSLTSLAGELIAQFDRTNSNSIQIPMNELPKGIYLVTIRKGNGITTFKIIKD